MNADEMVAYALEAPLELLPFLPELLADLDDLGCGQGATAIEIASLLELHVLGIELFEPLVAQATAAAQGDVLGSPAETMSVLGR